MKVDTSFSLASSLPSCPKGKRAKKDGRFDDLILKNDKNETRSSLIEKEAYIFI